ncbi:MAG: RNA polymerase factor sigma-32 [Rhodospirillaceae bacterium]|nr:RNA polymerase factor sigma-32 [Rhodospirillaceae bacterium]
MAVSNGNFPDKNDRRYISAAMSAPMLEREYEMDLGRRWRDHKDDQALHEMIESHIRLVVRIASKFKGYGLPVGDLIQEGNTGLLEAANRFDPERNVRFSTYATWWIMASMQEYIVRNSSIVRIGTTPAQKSLFFNLRKLRARLTDNLGNRMTQEERQLIASELGVPLAAVERMESHFSRPDRSLNATVGESDSDEFVDLLVDDSPDPEKIVVDIVDGETRAQWIADAMEHLTPREQEVIKSRFLSEEKTTLAEIGKIFGVTKERIRQIEGKALTKLRIALEDRDVGEGALVLN